MRQFVTDTHPLVWHLTGDNRLGSGAKDVFEKADGGESIIFVPSMVCVELLFLGERQRVPHSELLKLFGLFKTKQRNYQLATLDRDVIDCLILIPRDPVKEMPDRVIAATALALRLPLITKDTTICAGATKCSLEIIWDDLLDQGELHE